MPDILSQSEINELLNSLTSPNLATDQQKAESDQGKRIKEYDFKTPKKLTKEQIKIISGIYENFARHLSSYFSGVLRAYSQISIVSIEEQHYYEYNNALPDTVLIGVIELSPTQGLLLVDISNSITYNLIERILGGGSRESSIIPEREFSEIEISVMERILKQIAAFTRDAWSGYVQAEGSLKTIETNARLVQSIAMDELIVLVIMEVTIGNVKGTINFCIPCINVESLINKLNQNKHAAKRLLDSTQEEVIQKSLATNVKAAPLEMRAVLGETVLSLKEIVNLQVGDVIKFDQDASSKVMLKINGNETWFYGAPGIKKNKKAIKVYQVSQRRGM